MPAPACVEDYDDDASCVQSDTKTYARRRATVATSNPPKSIKTRYHYTTTKDGAGEPGPSSRPSAGQGGTLSSAAANMTSHPSSSQAAATAASAAMPPPPRPSTTQPQSKPKPVIHRSDSQRSRTRPPSRSSSNSRPVGVCNDPSCQDPNCPGASYATRRQSVEYGYAPQYAYGTSPARYQQAQGYPYAYVQASQATAPQVVSQPAAQPRPRASSSTRQARPVSFHGYPPVSYSGNQAGPSSAQSAYSQQQLAQWQYWMRVQQQQQQTYQNATYGAIPSGQTMYTPTSPIAASPTFPTPPTTVGPNATFSARMATATSTPSYATADVRYAAPLGRTMSARGPSGKTSFMPGTFPTQRYSSESETESESEYSEEEDRRRRSSRPRDSRLMSSSYQRRPSLPKNYPSAPVVPTHSSREILHRNPRSDNVIDYLSSSDNMDSDRTERAVVDRARTNVSTSTRSSRRPSLSTTASSGRTRLTNLSSATSGMNSMTISTRDRDTSYYSKRDLDDHLRARRRFEAQIQRERASEEYQDQMRGQVKEELTAENISRMASQNVQRNPSISSRSHRTSRSGKSKVVQGEGWEIKSGNTIINVTGDSNVSFMTGEDGAKRVVIENAAVAPSVVSAAGNGREREYVAGSKSSSKSSSSRVGRSRGGSEVDGGKAGRQRKRDSIQEEVEGG